MIRWGRVIGVFACLFVAAAPAHARPASAWAKATVLTCDTTSQFAVFEGKVTRIRAAARMQLRFTLQAQTPDEGTWQRVKAPGFGVWIAAPAAAERYVYDKRVEQLIAPGSYRVTIEFRWRDAKGRLIRSEKLTSPACKQPDPRPDLHVRDTRVATLAGNDRYVAVVTNQGRSAAAAFSVDFLREGQVIGTAVVGGLAVGEVQDAAIVAPACTPGDQLEAIIDPDNAVDESDEDDNTVTFTC